MVNVTFLLLLLLSMSEMHATKKSPKVPKKPNLPTIIETNGVSDTSYSSELSTQEALVLHILHEKMPEEYLWMLKCATIQKNWVHQKTDIHINDQEMEQRVEPWSQMTDYFRQTFFELAMQYSRLWLSKQSGDLMQYQHLFQRLDPSKAKMFIKLITVNNGTGYMNIAIEKKQQVTSDA